MAILPESQKELVNRSTHSVAAAGAASGAMDVAPINDEAPQGSQTSSKNGVSPPAPAKRDADGRGKTVTTTTIAKKTLDGSDVVKEVDSSAVAADNAKEFPDGVDSSEWDDVSDRQKI